MSGDSISAITVFIFVFDRGVYRINAGKVPFLKNRVLCVKFLI